ncbi:hypothetical protein M9H77_23357 [Catharanthus roseus]|uniref:Uncharacterized protein n=1 Tax=Catharanthus roseus TaxID=4058 RepID=A0ACC0AV96_CATRO|nr:hypothetical protein M9H77_23357 [Catharanthus roseus]
MSQSPIEFKLGSITRAQRKKLKIHEDNDMVAYIEEALKIKLEGFEGQEKASKLFSMCSISKDHSRESIGGENGFVLEEEHPAADGSSAPTVIDRLLPAQCLEDHALPLTVGLTLPLAVGSCFELRWKEEKGVCQVYPFRES